MPEQFTWHFLLRKPVEYLWPMTLGSLPLAILCWFVAFYAVRRLVRSYRVKVVEEEEK
jgi:hypothetical protein